MKKLLVSTTLFGNNDNFILVGNTTAKLDSFSSIRGLFKKYLRYSKFSSKKWHATCSTGFVLLDLALCNFWLFPKLKATFKGKQFQLWENIKQKLSKKHFEGVISEDFLEVAEALAKVCWPLPEIFWRTLNQIGKI